IIKNNKYFVLKSIRKDYIEKHNDHRHVKNERLVLQTLTSSFCIRYFGYFQDRYYIHFALEYCPGGELFRRLGRKKSFLSPVAKFYATEIFSALDHIHSLGFMYRDLKPENVLLDEEGHCKLVDFGFSRPCQDDDRIHTLCKSFIRLFSLLVCLTDVFRPFLFLLGGTPAYLSPEQLDGKLTNGYTRVVDWWSFGVLLYELLTGKTPFSKRNGESHYEIFLRILKSKIWFPMSFDGKSKELICALCHANVEKRLIDPIRIKAHGYFEIPWEIVEQRKLVPPYIPKLKDEGDCNHFTSYHDNGVPPNYKSDGENGGTTADQFFFDF
ncbi:MAG: serine/threonine-protein kinase, partial [Silvanigrellaceae bacterium]|nr:serine/threonine-protein kinase [Silvanigrellaceae bacterium]